MWASLKINSTFLIKLKSRDLHGQERLLLCLYLSYSHGCVNARCNEHSSYEETVIVWECLEIA